VLEKIVGCLYHREKTYGFINNGQGNCRICEPDEKNKACSGYYPISIYVFYVSEKIEKKDEQQKTAS